MRLFLIFSVLCCVSQLSSQTGMHLSIDYLKNSLISEELRTKVPELKQLRPALYRYEYEEGNSAFQFIGNIGEGTLKSFAYFNTYKDLRNNVIYYTLIKDPTRVCKDTLICESWELHPGEVKEIAGYTCHKASSENKYEAWYCEDISVSDGPLEQTCGLPGMILALKLGDIMTIEAVRVEISQSGAPVELPVVEKYIPKEDLLKIRRH